LGVLVLPLTLPGAISEAGFDVIQVLCTLGGCLGLWALFVTMRYYLSSKPLKPPNWSIIVALTAAGVVSIWTVMTGQFAGFELGWFSTLTMIAPTLCAGHILLLAMLKSKHESQTGVTPNNRLQRTGEE
jgi:hypothetical protein